MHRALVLLIALLLSFKTVAAGAFPIAGAPGHLHAAGGASSPHHAFHVDGAATLERDGHTGCAGHSGESNAPAQTLHDHSCPHIGMALAVTAQPRIALPSVRPLAPPAVDCHYTSIDLDVPSPPPTAAQ